MIYLIDTMPARCPSCGALYFWSDYMARSDFQEACAQVCKCGARFQYLETAKMEQAARLQPGSDLIVP